jgi:predicted nucleic acid-binding protein
MADTVIDASALAAVLFREPEGETVLDRCHGLVLRAPSLLDYEMANICLVKQRRYPDLAPKLISQFADYGKLALVREQVHIHSVRELAERTGLTAYDAAYLWLAGRHGCTLTTLDKKLDQAWRALQADSAPNH